MIEQVLEEKITEHICATYREHIPPIGVENAMDTIPAVSSTQWAKLNNSKSFGTEKGTFLTEVFERYKRMTREVEEVLL